MVNTTQLSAKPAPAHTDTSPAPGALEDVCCAQGRATEHPERPPRGHRSAVPYSNNAYHINGDWHAHLVIAPAAATTTTTATNHHPLPTTITPSPSTIWVAMVTANLGVIRKKERSGYHDRMTGAALCGSARGTVNDVPNAPVQSCTPP